MERTGHAGDEGDKLEQVDDLDLDGALDDDESVKGGGISDGDGG